jgi:hypothetical protein
MINKYFMRRIFLWLIPPDQWKSTVAVLSGIFLGLVACTFYISKAPS